MTARPDTGHRIHAAPSTAAFVRAQVANGVSVETLRRRLGIRPEHMLDMLTAEPIAAPLPRPSPRPEPERRPWSIERREACKAAGNNGGSLDTIVERSLRQRAEGADLVARIVPVVASLTGISVEVIHSRVSNKNASGARAMVFALAHELAPRLAKRAIGDALDRDHSSVEADIAKCDVLRKESKGYAAWYLRALSRLAP